MQEIWLLWTERAYNGWTVYWRWRHILFTHTGKQKSRPANILPERQALAYLLRDKTHNKILIDKTADLNERNFLIRLLYKDCYWLL